MSLVISSGVRIGGGTAVGIPPSISIIAHPIDVSAYAYETTSFSASATSQFGSVVSYQWQVQVGGTGSWANIPNATGSSYTTATLAVSGFHGNKYRALIRGSRGDSPVYTTEVTLSVLAATINVTISPSSQSVMAGATATFFVSASVNMGAVVSYQWQVYTSGTGQWSNISGATDSSFTTGTLSSSDDGNQYRVYITSGKGATPVTTSSATLTVQSLQANSMIIGSFVEGGGTEYFGAEAPGGWFNNMGSISSSVIFSVYKVVGSGYSNNNYAYVRFNDGNYDGFSISGGVFVGEQVSYDRIITIGGQNYHFKYDGNQYFNDGRSIIDLQNYVGQSVSLVYDNSIQPSYNPGTLIVGTSVPDQWSGAYYYGASDYLFGTVGVIGTMNNPMFSTVAFYYYPSNPSMSRTIITLHDGNYGSTSVVGGRIGSDSMGGGADGFYYRIFNCNGANSTFRWTGMEYEFTYSDDSAGDPFGLRYTEGQELNVQYDPTYQGPGGGVTVTGNMFVMSQYGMYYGASSGYVTQAYGTLWSFPSMVYQIQYDSNQNATTIYFLAGHYSGVAVTSSTIDGKTNASFVLGGVTRTGTLSSGGGAGPTLRLTGDPFSLQTKEYNMLSFSLTMIASSGGGGGSTPVTLSLNTGSTPSGFFYPPMSTSMFASQYHGGQFFFTSPTDANTFKTAAPTSFTFNDPYSGTTWSISGVSNITAAGSIAVDLSWTSANPTSPSTGMSPTITFTSAGGSTSTTYVAGVDYMDGSTGPYGIYFGGPGYMAGVELDQAAWLNMAGFTALTALTSGSTFTATMASTGSAPYTITVSGSWTGPSSNPFISASSSPSINISGPYYNHVPATITISSGGGGGGSTVTANLTTMNSPSGFYDPPNSSDMMSPSSTWGVFFFSTTEDATAIDNANPTSITYNDPYGGSKWTLSPVTNIYYSGGGSPSGYAVSIQWGSATPTGPSSGMTPTISYASAGGGGGPVSISNLAQIWFDDYTSPSQTAFYFANSSDATTAYGLLNGPGTWYITGNYMLQIYGMQLHGTYSITAMGPCSTDSMGPPGMQYRVIMPSSISNPQSDGPATNGPFSAHK